MPGETGGSGGVAKGGEALIEALLLFAALLFAALPFTAETETSRTANCSTANRSRRCHIGSGGQGVSTHDAPPIRHRTQLCTRGEASGRSD